MHQPPFERLLIANRGEIAIRIARAATELGIRTVGLYSYEDRFSLHRYKTDESYRIGVAGEPLSGYLNAREIVELAKHLRVDAIHPGYGFLSENKDFAHLCQSSGIKFVGPSTTVLDYFGNKSKARKLAAEAGLTILEGSEEPLLSVDEARMIARKIGYPVTLKAVSGGGGRGIRMVESEEELPDAFTRSSSEAMTAFGDGRLYIEKRVLHPRHIEVQILGDSHGNIVHLFERDCSIQRRNQKVVEVAPAHGISEATREQVLREAVKLANYVGYEGLGTVEFMVDQNGLATFLEVNPRVQVEHTVTEMVTGIDLLQASILVAAGHPLSHPLIGIPSQESLRCTGTAIQCRVTTENPLKNFAPDTGQIIAYRTAAGFGIRLDEGHGTSGATVTPYYDSLLVKITSWAKSLDIAASKMHRCLSEFRIRGVKHNIPLLKNVVNHPAFLRSDFNTDFLHQHQDIYNYVIPRDRATRLIRYIGDVTVNDPHDLGARREGLREAEVAEFRTDNPMIRPFVKGMENPKTILDSKGVPALVDWIKQQKRLLLTDTTMRDAHQSLFATRLRTRDILKIAPFYAHYAHQFFSLEVWGGATFDTCLRFLKEDPWERLSLIREAIPNILLQMLFRGDNAVGYTNYPHWVIRDFVREAKHSGIDIFRIFDCLNQTSKMSAALEEVKKVGGVAEISICYTGDVSNPARTKYNLQYYTKLARELKSMGADILCIKDMAGLLKPHAARLLIEALRDACDLPIHLHTHDTSGAGVSMLLEAAKAGCHIVDAAVSSMSGLTSQPSLNALIASLEGQPRDTNLPLEVADHLGRYWEGARAMYIAFDPGIKATSTDVYIHEIPGGQYSNLYEQAKKVGLTPEEFNELTKRYKEVNDLLGDIIKVTPSSKVVGDMALLLHKSKLTGPEYLAKKPKLDYPDSWISFLKGHMGEPLGGIPHELRCLALGDPPPPLENLAAKNVDSFESVQAEWTQRLGRPAKATEVLSARLYPKVFAEYIDHYHEFGLISELPTTVFFYGLNQGEEIEVDLEPGKTLYISLQSISKPNDRGRRSVFFRLNGFNRTVEVQDAALISKSASNRKKGSALDPYQIVASMPGKVFEVKAKLGDVVAVGQVLCVTESMKMEYAVRAKIAGTIVECLIAPGAMIEEGDLLLRLEK